VTASRDDGLGRARRVAPLAAISAVAGLALLAYAISIAGVAEITERLRRLGAIFLVIVALSGLRFAFRTWAWMACIEGQPRLRFVDAFEAKLIGDALGNLTPMGLFVAEPAKAMLVRRTVHVSNAVPAMLIENMVCALSGVVMIGLGALAVLVAMPAPGPLKPISMAILAGAVAATVASAWLMTAQPGLMGGAAGWLRRRNLVPHRLHQALDRVRSTEERVFGFAARHPARVPGLLLLMLAFHLVTIGEAYVTLRGITATATPSFLMAYLFEAINKIVLVGFTFVPLRLGVDEATTGFVARALQLGTATGVTLALVRKARMLCWSAVGVALLARRGFRRPPSTSAPAVSEAAP
jgi:hypothetical protein